MLLFESVRCFQLLGLALANDWASHGHMPDTLKKLKVRMAILQKVSNSRWGLENRILTITVHALTESILNYGLTVTGSAATLGDVDRMDTKILNPVAWRVVGVVYSIRRVYSINRVSEINPQSLRTTVGQCI